MVLPAGTTSTVMAAVDSYFLQPVVKTAFQVRVIEIVVVLAAVFIMCNVVIFVWRKIAFHNRTKFRADSLGAQVYGGKRAMMGWDGRIYAQGIGLDDYEALKGYNDQQIGRYNRLRELGVPAHNARTMAF